MEKDDSFDWAGFEKRAVERLAAGEELTGADGVLIPLIQRLVQASLEGEVRAHVEASRPNRRNGSKAKTLRSGQGLLRVDVPRDRDGSFAPTIVPKRSRALGAGLDEKILALYGLGMSYADIRAHLEEIYGVSVSEAAMTAVTDRVLDELAEWQSRRLEAFYPFVWLDALHCKVRRDGRVGPCAVHTVLALGLDGRKEVLGLYVGRSEGARLWLGVLTDLRQRGVEDVLVASVDGLAGFPEAVAAVFPAARVQLCLVHQMRNSLRFVPERDRRAVTGALRGVYSAGSLAGAQSAFEQFERDWAAKYPKVAGSWRGNWEELTGMFDFPAEIRRIVYTTNPVEGVHRQLRRVTKTKGAFVSEQALVKLLFLACRNISAKWDMPPRNWGLTLQQLYLLFPERLPPLDRLPGG